MFNFVQILAINETRAVCYIGKCNTQFPNWLKNTVYSTRLARRLLDLRYEFCKSIHRVGTPAAEPRCVQLSFSRPASPTYPKSGFRKIETQCGKWVLGIQTIPRHIVTAGTCERVLYSEDSSKSLTPQSNRSIFKYLYCTAA